MSARVYMVRVFIYDPVIAFHVKFVAGQDMSHAFSKYLDAEYPLDSPADREQRAQLWREFNTAYHRTEQEEGVVQFIPDEGVDSYVVMRIL